MRLKLENLIELKELLNQTEHSLYQTYYVINCCDVVTNLCVITLNVVINSCCRIVL